MDLELYKTLSSSNLKDLNKIFYATITVIGNYRCQELNVLTRHFHTHIIRQKNQIKYDKWKGQPSTAEGMEKTEQ